MLAIPGLVQSCATYPKITFSNVNIAIIGGGIAGLTAAHYLRQAGQVFKGMSSTYNERFAAFNWTNASYQLVSYTCYEWRSGIGTTRSRAYFDQNEAEKRLFLFNFGVNNILSNDSGDWSKRRLLFCKNQMPFLSKYSSFKNKRIFKSTLFLVIYQN